MGTSLNVKPPSAPVVAWMLNTWSAQGVVSASVLYGMPCVHSSTVVPAAGVPASTATPVSEPGVLGAGAARVGPVPATPIATTSLSGSGESCM